MTDINEVKGQAVEAGQKAYSFWQRAKDFVRANPGTVMAVAALVVVVVALAAL